MKVSICLLAVFVSVVVISKSDLSTGETFVNGAATSTKKYSSVTKNRDMSLIKEIFLKQDMNQALLLTNNVLQVMTDVQRLKEEVLRLNKENVDLRNQLSSFLNKSSDPRTPIAFYAYFGNDFKSMPKGSTFVFDVVETNLGNGYNKATGIFTAPSSGLYAFTWTVQAAGKHVVQPINSNSQYGEINAALMQNGAVKGVIVADTETKYDMDTATAFVVLETKVGDQFQIAVSEWDGQGDIYSNNSNGRTTFSGFMVS
nr:complement C1q tumor necrosis factor-related protein 3-like [Crassostrea gigas]